jgi:hypothetical protein
MKTIIRFGFLLSIQILFLSNLVMAQMPYNNQASPIDAVSADIASGTSTIKDITASLVENEVHVKLIIRGNVTECIYALERSVDGFNYQAISFKSSLALPNNNTEIMYCFKDTNPNDRISYYRIKQILPNEEKYSDAVIIYKKPEMQYVQQNF